MKMGMYVLIAVLISFFPLVSAEEVNEVILVSDNHADMAGAMGIADLINATVVTVPWGIYDKKIVDYLETLKPKKVIIIGGPLAVVEQYENDVKSLGIEVERIGGRNRYETNKMLLYRFRDKISNVSAVICHGYDEFALNESIAMHRVVILANDTDVVVPPMQYGIMHAVMMHTPIFNLTPVKLKIQKYGINVTVETLAEERIKVMIRNQIEHIKIKIEILKSQNIDTSKLEEELKNIENLYELGKYNEAYSAIIKLKHELMFSIGRGMGMQMGMQQRRMGYMGMHGVVE